MKKTHIGRGLLVLLLVSTCVFGFISFRNADTAKSANSQFIDPEDMVEGEVYYFTDHGNGMEIQFDRLFKGLIYVNFVATPSQSSFSRGTSMTIYDAGDIRLATAAEIAQLHRCIIADSYVP